MSILDRIIATPIAHRGLHDRTSGIIENTLTAATAAIEAGVAIECDVQLTSDGEAVVFHDFTLERLTFETGAVRERRARDLAAVHIAGSDGDRIPSLAAFLGHVAGRAPLVIEIKSRFDGDMTLTKRACEILSGYGGVFVVESFDPAVIATLRKLAPGVVRGIVAESHHTDSSYASLNAEQRHALANLLHYEETAFQFVSWRVSDLPAAAPYLSRVLGHLPLLAWTVRTPQDRDRAARHADQMVFEGFRP